MFKIFFKFLLLGFCAKLKYAIKAYLCYEFIKIVVQFNYGDDPLRKK